MSSTRFTLVSRENCGLCEEMFEAFQAFLADQPTLAAHCTLSLIDVDSDMELRRRYGHRIPVLLLDGEPVCHGHFDSEDVIRLLK